MADFIVRLAFLSTAFRFQSINSTTVATVVVFGMYTSSRCRFRGCRPGLSFPALGGQSDVGLSFPPQSHVDTLRCCLLTRGPAFYTFSFVVQHDQTHVCWRFGCFLQKRTKKYCQSKNDCCRTRTAISSRQKVSTAFRLRGKSDVTCLIVSGAP